MLAAVLLASVFAAAPAAASGLVTVKQLTPETALKAAQAALAYCRGKGYQIGVAVVDRAGVAQVFLRDRFAGAHTLDMAINKAWTAASFRIPTTPLAAETQPGRPMSGLPTRPRVPPGGGAPTCGGGGSGGAAFGVTGAPRGEADDDCARAGVKSIEADIAF
ncbi:MAG: heme-binding protein [Burkholderiaceae bacterium]|nr:heme-binding protein [Burkholderiaceae bacterium]